MFVLVKYEIKVFIVDSLLDLLVCFSLTERLGTVVGGLFLVKNRVDRGSSMKKKLLVIFVLFST